MANYHSCPHCGGTLKAVYLSLVCPICNDPYTISEYRYGYGRGHTCGKDDCRRAYRKMVYAAKVAQVVDTGRLCKCGCGKIVKATPFRATVTLFATKKCRNWYHGTYLRKAKNWTQRGAK